MPARLWPQNGAWGTVLSAGAQALGGVFAPVTHSSAYVAVTDYAKTIRSAIETPMTDFGREVKQALKDTS